LITALCGWRRTGRSRDAGATQTGQSRDSRKGACTTRTIRVLDLTDLPYVSMFDPVLGNLDEWADFMGAFIRDFQRPVSADGEHHYEYVPTQIVTEYFRAGLGATGKIDGVKYRSVKKGGGVCVVLFTDNTDVDPIMDLAKSPDGAHLLKMRRVAHKNR
jgi:hypothetical protein